MTRVPEIHGVDIVGCGSCQGDSRAGLGARGATAPDRLGKTYTGHPRSNPDPASAIAHVAAGLETRCHGYLTGNPSEQFALDEPGRWSEHVRTCEGHVRLSRSPGHS